MEEDLFNIGFNLDEIATEEVATDEQKPITEVQEENLGDGVELDLEEQDGQVEVEEETTEVITETETEVTEEVEPEVDETFTPQTAIYEILKNYGYADNLEEGQEIDLDQAFENLGDKVFAESIQSLNPNARKILEIAYSNKGVVTDDDLKSLINVVTEQPSIDYKENPREFLNKELEGHTMFPTNDELNDYLDDLEEKQKLTGVAENIFKQLEEKKVEQEEKLQQEITARKEQEEKRRQEYINSITNVMDETSWTPQHKTSVSQVINNLGNISNKINSNPKALVALADILTTFDEKTGEFNLEKITKTSSKKASETANKVRSNKIGNILSKMDKSKIKSKTKKADDDNVVVIIPD